MSRWPAVVWCATAVQLPAESLPWWWILSPPPDVYGTVSFMELLAHRMPSVSARLVAIAKSGCPTVGSTGRGADRENAICEAVIELLGRSSYESVTMDAVAAQAKASKATIYRRWTNKDELFLDALRRALASVADDILPDTGRLRDDLVARILQQLHDPLRSAATTAAMKGLVHAASSDPALAEAIRDSLRDAQLGALQTLLARAHARGELAGEVDAGLLFEIVQGQFCARTSIDSEMVDREYTEHIVDDVLMPVISHAGAHAGSGARR